MKHYKNQIGTIILLIIVLFSACKKENGVDSGTTPSNTDTITSSLEAGQILVYNYQNYSIQNSSVFSGQTTTSWQDYSVNNIEPSIIDSGILYLGKHSALKAINLTTGNVIFQKSFSPIYLNTTSVLCYPVIKDSVLYFVSHGEGNEQVYLHAFNKKTGVKLYSTNISLGLAITSPMLSTPLINGNNILVTFQQNSGSNKYPSIFCLNRQTGALLWNRTFGYNQSISTFTSSYSNTILLSLVTGNNSTSTDILALDATNGNTVFQNNYLGVEFLGTERKYFNNFLYNFSYSSINNVNDVALNTINPSNGNLENKFTIGTIKFFLDSNNLFFVKDGKLNKYSLANKNIVWSKVVASETFRKTQIDSNSIVTETTSPLVTDKYIYTMEWAYNTITQNDLMNSVIIYNKETGKKIYELKNFSGFSFSRFIVKNSANTYFYQNKREVSYH